MRAVACLLAIAAAAPAAPQERLPSPPPPPGDARYAQAVLPRRPGTLGVSPVARAGSQAAPLGGEARPAWRFALATGVAGRFGGRRLEAAEENRALLLYVGAQADGSWGERVGQAARLRLRLLSGGESHLFVPSDGDAEAAYLFGRRELRFVVGRVEVARHPALGIQLLAQAATLPSIEGSLPLGGDTMRLDYQLHPVEAAWVRYEGGAHLAHRAGWPTESDRPFAASAGRLRYSVLLPPATTLSVQGDLAKAWGKADLLLSAEAAVGYQAFERTALFDLGLRWSRFARRGALPDTDEDESELIVLASATLAL